MYSTFYETVVLGDSDKRARSVAVIVNHDDLTFSSAPLAFERILMHNILASTPKQILRTIDGTSAPLLPLLCTLSVITVIAVANDTMKIVMP